MCKLPQKQYGLKVDKSLTLKRRKMKKGKFNSDQIAKILMEFEQRKSVEDISRVHGVSRASFYKWRQRYGGWKLAS